MIYDNYGRTEPSRIYLARPGKKLLGCLNGVNEESCSLTIDFINADTLTFNVYKYHEEELTAYYDYIDVLMELYVDGYGWFIIEEVPSVHNDGIAEYKSVTAESYEKVLQHYDLVGFDVNTASPTSSEMLAPDNVYTYYSSAEVWYNMFRDRVLFYRDSSDHKSLLGELNTESTYEDLQELFVKYPKVLQSDWRFVIKIDDSLRAAFVTMKENAETQGEINTWQNWIDTYDDMMASGGSQITSDGLKTQLILSYPELIRYLTFDIDKNKYKYDDLDDKYVKLDEEYTAYEIAKLEYDRIKGLSLLDLVLSDIPDWSVGTVDRSLYDTHTDINGSQILLENEVGWFEIDSQDVYTFLVNDLSGYFECIFQFDTDNNLVNAYRIESLGIDTKIFLGFRNVQNNVDITPAQELYTQFTVENSEGLSITNVNFGTREIEDISYFLNTKYLPQNLIDKYKVWQKYRESVRDQYIQLSRDYNNQLEVLNEIQTRVPSDMLNISQLDGYKSQDQLEHVIDNYYALMIGILNQFIYVSTDVDPPEDRETYEDYNEYIDDMNDYIEQLESYVDVGKDERATSFADSVYYKDYQLMKEFTVPNLVITYNNLDLPSYETKQDYYDAYEFDFQQFGWMYGIDELKTYQQSHLDKMETLKEYELAWSEIPDTEEGRAYKEKYEEQSYTTKHQLYLKYKAGYDSATQELAVRQTEYDNAKAQLYTIGDARQLLADNARIENFSQQTTEVILYEIENGWFYQEDQKYLILDEYLGEAYFTADEIAQINRFYKHTDYSNDNINYLDQIDDMDTIIDKQLEMYNEAVDELYAQAHPQYTYTTNLDNLLANNEYEDYHPDFKVGNFVRLGLDDETQVQLRMITIEFNPTMIDNNLNITFSNMVNYKSRRNDFASLLNSAITSAKNSINARYRREADNDNTVQVTYDLVQKILQSSPFTNYAQNIQQNSVNAATGSFQTLTTGFLKTDELAAEVGNITELHSDSVFANYIKSQLIASSTITADQIVDGTGKTVVDLVNDNIDIGSITTDIITGHDSQGNYYIDLIAGEIAIDRLVSSDGQTAIEFINGAVSTDAITANIISGRDSQGRYYIDLLAGEIAIDRLTSSDGKTAVEFINGAVSTERIATDLITGRDGQDRYYIDLISGALNMNTIASNSAFINSLTSQQAFIDYLNSNLIVAKAVEADSVKAENIDFTTASGAEAFIEFIQAHSINATNIKAAVAEIDTLAANSAFSKYLQSLSSTTAQAVINDAYIQDAIVGKITVADLAAGDIVLADKMRILSENNGAEGIVMSGSEIQFLDDQGNPSISIGYNTISDGQGGTTVDYSSPAIVIKDANGSVMLNSAGLSQGDVGLASMIQTSSISKSQLNFPIVDTDEHGNISITNVLNPEGGNFGVEYVNFKNNTNTALDALDEKIDNVAIYEVKIDAPQGTNIRGQTIQLDARLFKNSVDVTDEYDASCFIWTRQSKDSYGDIYWNNNHSTGTKSIIVTANDVRISSDFKCTFTYEDISVTSD